MAESAGSGNGRPIAAGDWLRTLPPAARFILQGGPAARVAAGVAFGVPLPERACRANATAERAALWLGPDEQLLLAPSRETASLAAGLEAALADIAHSLVDVSHRQVAVAVRGPDAGAILNSGCPLDLDLGIFPVGMCTRTLLGKAQIVLWRRDRDEFHVEVWRSFFDYAWSWLLEAAADVASEQH